MAERPQHDRTLCISQSRAIWVLMDAISEGVLVTETVTDGHVLSIQENASGA